MPFSTSVDWETDAKGYIVGTHAIQFLAAAGRANFERPPPFAVMVELY